MLFEVLSIWSFRFAAVRIYFSSSFDQSMVKVPKCIPRIGGNVYRAKMALALWLGALYSVVGPFSDDQYAIFVQTSATSKMADHPKARPFFFLQRLSRPYIFEMVSAESQKVGFSYSRINIPCYFLKVGKHDEIWQFLDFWNSLIGAVESST